MESHEEKLHKMIIQSKINDTKDIMKRKAMEIDKHKMEQKRSLPAGETHRPHATSEPLLLPVAWQAGPHVMRC